MIAVEDAEQEEVVGATYPKSYLPPRRSFPCNLSCDNAPQKINADGYSSGTTKLASKKV